MIWDSHTPNLIINDAFWSFQADNQTKRRRHNIRRKDFSVFNQPTPEDNRTNMSPQLMLATFQYLQTSKSQLTMKHVLLWVELGVAFDKKSEHLKSNGECSSQSFCWVSVIQVGLGIGVVKVLTCFRQTR